VTPLAGGMGLCLSNCPTHLKEGFTFSPTHKIETKRTIQIKNPKNSIGKTKRREKKKTKKKKTNKIFQNYKNKK
jgi:hypothetical protein